MKNYLIIKRVCLFYKGGNILRD